MSEGRGREGGQLAGGGGGGGGRKGREGRGAGRLARACWGEGTGGSGAVCGIAERRGSEPLRTGDATCRHCRSGVVSRGPVQSSGLPSVLVVFAPVCLCVCASVCMCEGDKPIHSEKDNYLTFHQCVLAVCM